MSESRKKWTRKYITGKLNEIHDILKEVRGLAKSGDMPPRLRNKVSATVRQINGTTRSLQNWAITSQEKAARKVKRTKTRKGE